MAQFEVGPADESTLPVVVEGKTEIDALDGIARRRGYRDYLTAVAAIPQWHRLAVRVIAERY